METQSNLLSSKNPLWLAGFRPFFLLAMVMGVVMPSLWGFVFTGKFILPAGINPLQWHVHEMLFGFGGAVLFGFLLTASKNWVKVRGIHGVSLMVWSGLWLFERIFIYFSGQVDPLLKHIGLSLFVVSGGAYIIWTLVKYRQNDSFRDNYFFLFLLAFIVLAKNLLISESYYQHGVSMSLGLFRLAFVVMFERTITQFMKGTEGVTLYQNPVLDYAIKISVALCIFQSFFSTNLSTLILCGAGGLLLLRWFVWRPDLGFRKFGNGTMYLGYLGLALHLFFEASKLSGLWSQAALSIHVFTFLCMGIVIPSMIVRISKGHTGRKPEFLFPEKMIIYSLLIASVFRLLIPLMWPMNYPTWILIAGLFWSAAFLGLFIRVSSFLLNPRIDGKIH